MNKFAEREKVICRNKFKAIGFGSFETGRMYMIFAVSHQAKEYILIDSNKLLFVATFEDVENNFEGIK